MADTEEILHFVVDFLRKQSFVEIAQDLENEISKTNRNRHDIPPSSRLEVLIKKGLAYEKNPVDDGLTDADFAAGSAFSPRQKFHAGSLTGSGSILLESIGSSVPKIHSPLGNLEGESKFRASSRHSRESHQYLTTKKYTHLSASLPSFPPFRGARNLPAAKPVVKKKQELTLDSESSDEDQKSDRNERLAVSTGDIFTMDLTPPNERKPKANHDDKTNPAFQNPTNESLEYFDLKVIYQPNHTGFEESRDFPIRQHDIIAGRYEITQYLGSAAFSRAVQCHDHLTNTMVCIKIIKNTKDFLDQCLDEIKLLKYIKRKGNPDSNHVLRMYDFFYFKEHLFIVCELLGENLYEFYKVNLLPIPYFTLPRLQKVARQVLIATSYIHGLDLIHCDLKPENILMADYKKCQIKVIDFGSSCFVGDELSTYVQSRSYRAPEVILGCNYGQKIDLWSIGCILAELFSGSVLFQNNSVATLLGRINSIIGPFQKKMLDKGKFTNKFYRPEGILFEKGKDGISQVKFPKTTLKERLGTDDDNFVDFLQHLLKLNPKERFSAQEALQHPWLSIKYDDEEEEWSD